MKKIIIIIAILIVSIVLFIFTRGFIVSTSPPPQKIPAIVAVPTSTPTPPIVQVPKRLKIGAIDVDAAIEPVGMDSEGRMDVPKDPQDVAWFQPGYNLASVGNVVLAGHLDNVDGSPAVFYNISQLKKGDVIEVVDDSDTNHMYRVVKTASYPHDQVPMKEIFGPSSIKKLNLITCEGVFDRAEKTYSNRFVVYAED